MTLSALQGRVLTRLVEDVRTLLEQGEAPSSFLRALEAVQSKGLWSEHGEVAVARPAVVTLIDRLPKPGEALPAVLSLVPEVRDAWVRVVRARFAEMGERGDVAALTDAITHAGALASELVGVQAPSLAATPFGELERAVLTTPAHEAPAFPVLLRVLAATAALTSDPTPVTLPTALPEVAYDDPSGHVAPGSPLASARFRGDRDDDGGVERRARRGGPTTQTPCAGRCITRGRSCWRSSRSPRRSWEAERVSGGIAFELEPAHASLFQSPPRVEVVVSLPSGEEIRCGSLGELCQRTLAQLGVTVLGHRVTANTLDDKLALVIEAVLRHDVWRFEHGSGARRPGYTIHPLVLRRLLSGTGQPGLLPARLAGDRRHPPRRRGLGQGAHARAQAVQRMTRTLHLERPAFWTETSDPEAWFRALDVLASKPPELGSPRSVADRALVGVISRRGAAGLFGLLDQLLPGVGLVTRDTEVRWTVSDEAQVLLRCWKEAPPRGLALLAAHLVRESVWLRLLLLRLERGDWELRGWSEVRAAAPASRRAARSCCTSTPSPSSGFRGSSSRRRPAGSRVRTAMRSPTRRACSRASRARTTSRSRRSPRRCSCSSRWAGCRAPAHCAAERAPG
jgi:hypothetical protein